MAVNNPTVVRVSNVAEFICIVMICQSILMFWKTFLCSVLLDLFSFTTEYIFYEITFYALSNNRKCKREKGIPLKLMEAKDPAIGHLIMLSYHVT